VRGLGPGSLQAFFDCLSEIVEDEQNKPTSAISEETMLYWRKAAGHLGRSERHA
jgi:hypothetical protein